MRALPTALAGGKSPAPTPSGDQDRQARPQTLARIGVRHTTATASADEVLGLSNNFILHKIADGTVVDRLRKSISGIDRGQWGMLPGLAPGQELVSLTHMTRPLLVSDDPAPCQLKLLE